MEKRIKIRNGQGFAKIVASAFDPSRHELYAEGGDLRARAKALGIKGAHLMKPETLAKRVREAEANGA